MHIQTANWNSFHGLRLMHLMNAPRQIADRGRDYVAAQRTISARIHASQLPEHGEQDPIFINARFAAQRMSGIQRFSSEMTSALQNIYTNRLRILVPPGAGENVPSAIEVGKRHGQAWEQWDLPRHAASGFLVNLGNTAPLLAKRQLVVIHDAGVFVIPEAYNWRFRLWYKTLQSALARRHIQIVTVSASSRADIVRHLSIDPSCIEIIPEGADHVDRISANHEILERLDLTCQKFVLTVGNLAPHKNLGALNTLAGVLAERGIKLVVTGAFGGTAFSGGNTSLLPHPACYAGRVSDAELKALYKAAACYVLPSRYEGFGLPAVEAMRCGCPVVVADIPALRETCGKAALFCDPFSPENIARRVTMIIDDDSIRTGLRAAGITHTSEMSWANAAQHLSLIIAAAQGKDRQA